jgi:hypothetical protein
LTLQFQAFLPTPHKMNIVLIQEPRQEKMNDTYASVTLKGWQPLLPEMPRTKAYVRRQVQIEIALRNDLGSDFDFTILEAKRKGSSHDPTRLINIYNQTSLTNPQTGEYTTDRRAHVRLAADIPTVITGDWNMRHPERDD